MFAFVHKSRLSPARFMNIALDFGIV